MNSIADSEIRMLGGRGSVRAVALGKVGSAGASPSRLPSCTGSVFLVIACLLGFSAASVFRASAADEPPRPREPLLSAMPARAAWMLEFLNAGDPGNGEAGSPLPLTANRITVFKDGATYRVVSEKSIDGCREAWVVEGLVFLLNSSSRCALVDNFIFPCTDFSAGDFEDFQWLRLSDYAGLGDFDGKKAFVFEADSLKRPMSARDRSAVATTRQSLQGDELSLETTAPTKAASDSDVLRLLGWGTTCRAWLDVATQKPLYLESGDHRIRVKYLPPPEPLALPQPIALRMEAIRKERLLLQKRPTRSKR